MSRRLSRPKALLIDLSGTIHVENEAVPGAIDAIAKLKTHRIPHLFVTNTSKVGLFETILMFYKKKNLNDNFRSAKPACTGDCPG